MQISTELERKAEPSQGGHLESELRGHLLLDGHGELRPNPRAGQPPSNPSASSKAPGTQTHQENIKEVLFLE